MARRTGRGRIRSATAYVQKKAQSESFPRLRKKVLVPKARVTRYKAKGPSLNPYKPDPVGLKRDYRGTSWKSVGRMGQLQRKRMKKMW